MQKFRRISHNFSRLTLNKIKLKRCQTFNIKYNKDDYSEEILDNIQESKINNFNINININQINEKKSEKIFLENNDFKITNEIIHEEHDEKSYLFFIIN